MNSKLLATPAALMLLAGCNTVYEHSGSTDPGLGEAAKYNMAVQTIDPDPVYTADGAQPGEDGAKGAAAVKRYRTDAVKALQIQSSTTSSGGGGGGGGGLR